MKVKYPGPGDTYHPQLGKLIAGKPFDLDDETAKKYIDSGLLKGQKSPVSASGYAAAGKTAKPKTKNATSVIPANAPIKSPLEGGPTLKSPLEGGQRGVSASVNNLIKEKSNGKSTNR